MNVSVSKTKGLMRVAAVDILLIGLMIIVPTVSHALSFPLYKLNPMLLCLLAGMLIVRDHRNAFLLALLLPLVPMIVTGMPAPAKSVCMIGELLAIVGTYQLFEKKMPVFLAMMSAILTGKVFYYLLKAVLISPVALVGTEWWMQLAVVTVWCGLFSFISVRRRR